MSGITSSTCNTIPHGELEALALLKHSTRPVQRVRIIGKQDSIMEQARSVLAMQGDPLDTTIEIVSLTEYRR